MKRLILILLLFPAPFLEIFAQVTITVSNDTTICLGGTTTLGAVVTGGSYGTNSYTFETYPYAPEPFSGGTGVCSSFTNCTSTAGGKDDCLAGPFNIGFNFCFFNQTYTQFWIGSNGWISFSAPPGSSWDTFTATTIPNSSTNVPKNAIFFPWEDWLPCKNTTVNVYYYNSGTAPNRKLVVYWLSSPFYGCSSLYGTFEVVLNEQSSIIENHIQSKPLCGNEGSTQGVQNATGTVAFTATGRNDTPWTTNNESTRFVPSGITWYTGGYPGGTIVGYGTPITFNPTSTTTYTAVVTLCDGSIASANVTVTVVNSGFSYPAYNYCQSEPDPTPSLIQPGGVFTVSPPGLVWTDYVWGIIDLSMSQPGNYTVTYTRTSGNCTTSTSHIVTIVGIPLPPVPVASYVSRCGQGTVSLAVNPVTFVTMNWYNLPAGGTLLNTGTTYAPNITVSTHFYVEALNPPICASLTRSDIFANIRPIPLISNTTLDYTLCSRDTTKINLTCSQPNPVFTWSAFSNSPTLTGYSSGTGPAILQKLTNSGFDFDTVTYTVVAVADTCTSPAVNFRVVVKPWFNITATPVLQTICSDATTGISLSSSVPSATFSWTASSVDPLITGYSSGTGSSISQTLVNMGTASGLVKYKATAMGMGCTGDTASIAVTIKPYPDLTNIPLTKSICNNTSTGITLTSSVPGALFTWTATPGSPNLSGYSDNPLPMVILDQTLVNSGYTNGNVTYHVLPHANGCDGVNHDFIVWVHPVSNLIMNPVFQTICSRQQSNILLSSNVTGTAFSWSAQASIPEITGYTAGSGNQIKQNLVNSATIPGTVTYQISTVAYGCTGNSDSVKVTVNPVLPVIFTACTDTLTTTNAKPFQLKGGEPLNGIYSGAGVTPATGIFNPTAAGAGNHVLSYSYTNIFSCSTSASRTFHVLNPVAFNCGNTYKDIRDNKNYPTIQLGTQCWMALNLNYGTFITSSSPQRDNCISEKYCYNDNTVNCTSFGGLYQWDEMMQYQTAEGSQGFCPPAWHVPGEAEWNTLFNLYTNNGFAGFPLKVTGYSGFSALLTGMYYLDVQWSYNSFATMFWSSTLSGPGKTWAHGMNDYNPSVSFYPAFRSNAFSIRCIRD